MYFYDNVLFVAHFNSEVTKSTLRGFLEMYNKKFGEKFKSFQKAYKTRLTLSITNLCDL